MVLKVVKAAAAALLLSACPSFAQDPTSTRWEDFHGLWVEDMRRCAEDGDHLRYDLAARHINSYERQCEIIDRRRTGAGFMVRARCSAEGEVDSATFVVERTRSGRIVLTETGGGSTSRHTLNRCPGQQVVQAPSGSCVNVGPGQQPTFIGRLAHRIFAGPPNYTDVRRGDQPAPAYILHLERPICVTAENDDFLKDVTTETVHLLAIDRPDVEAQLRSLIGRTVAVTGTDGFGAHTAHHRAPLVLGVVTVVPAEAATSSDGAITTVEAFYRALQVGDGLTAAEMVVPWKRSGAFSAAAMSRFYGGLSEPLRLIEVVPAGPGRFEARYTFANQGRRCNGRALVYITRTDGLNLIESIRSLSGC